MNRLRLFIPILFVLFMYSCRKHENERPRWDTQVLAPLLKSSLSMKDLITDTLIKSNPDSSLKVVYNKLLYELAIDSLFSLPETTVVRYVKLDSIKIDDQIITHSISLGTAMPQLAGLNGFTLPIPEISTSPPDTIPIDAKQYFETMTLKTGTMDITISNGFPIDVDTLIFQLKNLISQSVIVEDTFPPIPKGTTVTQTIPLDGKTIEGQMIGRVLKIHSPGDTNGITIDTSDSVVFTIKVYNLHPDSATAIFPNQKIVDLKQKLPFSLKDVQFINGKVRSGLVKVEAFSTLKDTVHFHFEIPSATLIGNMFQVDDLMPPAPPSGVSHFLQTYDFSGYDLDMRGLTGDTVNSIYYILNGIIDSHGQMRTIALTDSFYFYVGFEDLLPEYGRGYLGRDTILIGPDSTTLDLFNKVLSGSFNLEDVQLNFSVENGIGADARLTLKSATSHNSKNNTTVSLGPPVVNSAINISRAALDYSFYPPATPSVTNIFINNSNSGGTATKFIENMPDKLGYGLQVITNPNGNVSGGNDFIFYESKLRASLNMEFPLSLIANNLTLCDTADFDISKQEDNLHKIKGGTLTLIADNGFPFDATIQLYMLSEQGAVTDSLLLSYNNKITAAPVGSNNKVVTKKRSKLLIPLSEDKINKLLSTKKIREIVTFNTVPSAQLLKIYSDYSIGIKLTGDFIYRIE